MPLIVDSHEALSDKAYLPPHIDVCALSSCYSNCVCLTCSTTFYLYDSTGTIVDSCTALYPFTLCCTITNTHPAGNYHFRMIVANCVDCNSAVFYYDGTTASVKIDCSNCANSSKTGLNDVPLIYSLAQNYPNPFNPATTISYSLPKAGFVNLIVYDVVGKEVATPVNEYKDAGTYTIDFDASGLASGIYFYKISVDDNTYTAIRKMMLLK